MENKQLKLDKKSADMSELVSCVLCGVNTRTEWTLRQGDKILGQVYACSEEKHDVVWNRILSQNEVSQ